MDNISKVNILKEEIEVLELQKWQYLKVYNKIIKTIDEKKNEMDKICNHERVKDHYTGHETEWICKHCGL